MFEALKTLSPKQRLVGFVIAVIITAITSISTVYMNTSDCEGISTQYTKLVKNQADLMEINNDLLYKYNSARKDIIAIQVYIQKLEDIRLAGTEITTTRKTVQPIVNDTFNYQPNDSLSPVMMMITPEAKPVTVLVSKKTIYKPAPKEMTNAIDSITTIINKYKL